MKWRVIDPLARRGRSNEEISEELRAWDGCRASPVL